MKIQLLGGFSVRADADGTAAEVAVRGQKNQGLLIWLAGHDRPQARDLLSGLFWGDHNPESARTSLRQALSALRRALPEGVLVSEGDTVRLDLPDDAIDVRRFRALAAASDPEDWFEAATVYAGTLLDGVRINSDGFEDWLRAERENLRRLAMETFRRALRHEQVSADTGHTMTLCQQLLAMDPLQEEAHRLLIAALARSGQSGEARRQLAACEEVMRRELGVDPAPETYAALETPVEDPSGTSNAPPTPEPATEARDRRPAPPSLAVLPFLSMSSDPEHGYLADGMTEELINLLAQSATWRVTARNSSFRYKGQNVDVREVGRDLGVGYIVEGSVRRVGSRIRVTAQLVNTEDGTHIWSDRYDRELSDIFDVQDEVVHAIFRVLKNRLGFAERERIRRTQTANLDAWGLLVKANQIRVRDGQTRDEQRAIMREALSIDPNYPRAHAFLASILFLSIGRGFSPDFKADYQQAREHAEQALTSGNTDVVVLRLIAGGYAAVGRSKEALEMAQRARELSGRGDALLVATLIWNGRLDEAQSECQALVDAMPPDVPTPPGELRPVSLLGNIKMLNGDLEQAKLLAEQDIRSNPTNYFAHANLANVAAQQNDFEQARYSWNKAVELLPALTVELFKSGYDQVFTEPELSTRFCQGLLAMQAQQPDTSHST